MNTKITLLLLLLGSAMFSQKHLPLLIEKDTTIEFNKRVWIQSEKSEIQQRYKEAKLTQKLETVKKSIKSRRDTLNRKILALLDVIDSLKADRDSAIAVYELSSTKGKEELDKIIAERNGTISFLQRKYETYLVKYLFYKKWMIRVVLLSVGELVLILVLI